MLMLMLMLMLKGVLLSEERWRRRERGEAVHVREDALKASPGGPKRGDSEKHEGVTVLSESSGSPPSPWLISCLCMRIMQGDIVATTTPCS